MQLDLDTVRAAAKAHGRRLAGMEDWELLTVLDAGREHRYRLEAMVAAGVSNKAAAKRLNEHGLTGPKGGLWTTTSIRRVRARLGI